MLENDYVKYKRIIEGADESSRERLYKRGLAGIQFAICFSYISRC